MKQSVLGENKCTVKVTSGWLELNLKVNWKYAAANAILVASCLRVGAWGEKWKWKGSINGCVVWRWFETQFSMNKCSKCSCCGYNVIWHFLLSCGCWWWPWKCGWMGAVLFLIIWATYLKEAPTSEPFECEKANLLYYSMIASKVGDGAVWEKRLLLRGMYVAGILNCGKRQRLKKRFCCFLFGKIWCVSKT